MSDVAPVDLTSREARSRGLRAAVCAYGIWGFLPVYIKLLSATPAAEVTFHRILWSIPAAGLAMAVLGGAGQTWTALKKRETQKGLIASAIAIGLNWGLFVWAVIEGHILEASLGYFIVPFVNVAAGVWLFSERLSRLKMIALAFAGLGVLNQITAIGGLPFIALGLCATWSFYGIVRKKVDVPAIGGLLVEASLLIAPVLVIALALGGGLLTFGGSPLNAWLLVLSGPLTALPLVLFAFGARRLPMTILGPLQFAAPSLQFMTGLLFGEAFDWRQAISFGLIWIGLLIFSYELIHAAKASPESGAKLAP